RYWTGWSNAISFPRISRVTRADKFCGSNGRVWLADLGQRKRSPSHGPVSQYGAVTDAFRGTSTVNRVEALAFSRLGALASVGSAAAATFQPSGFRISIFLKVTFGFFGNKTRVVTESCS